MLPAQLLLALLFATGLAPVPSVPEKLIDAGHWKRARALVEARLHEAPEDALSHFLLSQIRAAFGDRATPLPLAEKAVALDPSVAKYHRQVAEVLGIMAQHSNLFQQLLLARRFRKEIDLTLSLDPRDIQAQRDLMEFYLLAPSVAGGDSKKAAEIAARIASIDAAEGFLAQARIAEFHRDRAAQEAALRSAVHAAPENYRAHLALAQLANDEAQARAAIEIDPGRADAYSVLAGIYASRGAWEELDSILAAASRAVPDDAAPLYRAAERLCGSGRDRERADRYLRMYLERPPEGNEPSTAQARAELALCEKSH